MRRFDAHFLDEIRDRVPISQVIGSRVTWDRKKTNASRGDWWACCPIHGEKSPSFHCEDRKGRYHCFGCGASGDHFRFLMEVDGMAFIRAVETVAGYAGMQLPGAAPPTEEEKREQAARARRRAAAEAQRKRDEERAREKRIKSVREIWQETKLFRGSLAEAYTEWRCPGLGTHADENLRFHPGLEHPDVPGLHPVLVGRVQDAADAGIAIWRIYLAADGRGKLRVPEGSNAKLGLGPSAGGAVRIGGLAKTIGICEGIETALAIRCLETSHPVWAGLSTSGIISFQIPKGVERVIVFPDPDGDKLRTKTRRDGTRFIAQPPGQEAARKFIEANPGRDIRISDTASTSDFLEILQAMKGVPLR